MIRKYVHACTSILISLLFFAFALRVTSSKNVETNIDIPLPPHRPSDLDNNGEQLPDIHVRPGMPKEYIMIARIFKEQRIFLNKNQEIFDQNTGSAAEISQSLDHLNEVLNKEHKEGIDIVALLGTIAGIIAAIYGGLTFYDAREARLEELDWQRRAALGDVSTRATAAAPERRA